MAKIWDLNLFSREDQFPVSEEIQSWSNKRTAVRNARGKTWALLIRMRGSQKVKRRHQPGAMRRTQKGVPALGDNEGMCNQQVGR